jgi:hypothetical protein
MSRNFYAVVSSYDHVDCFGTYNKNNPLCAKHCALRIRCAIEQDQNLRTELIDELVGFEDVMGRMQ